MSAADVAASAAFVEALRLVASSKVVVRRASPLDTGDNDEFHTHIERLERLTADVLVANGCTGPHSVDQLGGAKNFPHTLQDDLVYLMRHHIDVGYIYGLAVGLTLGGTR